MHVQRSHAALKLEIHFQQKVSPGRLTSQAKLTTHVHTSETRTKPELISIFNAPRGKEKHLLCTLVFSFCLISL